MIIIIGTFKRDIESNKTIDPEHNTYRNTCSDDVTVMETTITLESATSTSIMTAELVIPLDTTITSRDPSIDSAIDAFAIQNKFS